MSMTKQINTHDAFLGCQDMQPIQKDRGKGKGALDTDKFITSGIILW